MDSLRLKNYRCFDDTGEVQIKPINFLVGANSSGKSSFLKFFPLLKQSVGIRRRGLFLWLSNDVDFRDFANTVKDGVGDIEISFRINHFGIGSHDDPKVSMVVNLVVSQLKENFDYLKKLSFAFEDQSIEINIDQRRNSGIVIN